MRKLLVLLPLLAAGCDDRPIPIDRAPEIPSVVGVQQDKELLAPRAAPATSEPAAVELVAQAIAAHTDNHPERVGKLKTAEFKRTGMGRSVGPDPIYQVWAFDVAWPDRYHIRAELPALNMVVTVGWSPAGGFRTATPINSPTKAAKERMADKQVKDHRLDATGEWLWLLFPLVEPETVLAAAAAVEIDGKPHPGVRLWHPRLSTAVVHFDPDTKLLKRVTFEGHEDDKPVVKEFTVTECKEFAGVKLPLKMGQKWSGSEYANWTLESVTPREKLDAKLFEMPSP